MKKIFDVEQIIASVPPLDVTHIHCHVPSDSDKQTFHVKFRKLMEVLDRLNSKGNGPANH
jgi:hypothetical protein